ILYCIICEREDHRTLAHEMYTGSLKRSENYKAQPYQYASPSKQILKAKEKPFLSFTHYGFNDHIPDDYRNYPECEIYESYDHSTSGYNRVIHIRGGVLTESSQSSKSSIGFKCNICGSTVHSTTDHNEFGYFNKAIRFTNTLVDEIGIDDSSRYPPDEYHYKNDPSRQYQSNPDISDYIIPHGRLLTELAQEKHVPEVIAPNKYDIPHTKALKVLLT
nr:hypothetical protein [Tanacetum cinerariifolium]